MNENQLSLENNGEQFCSEDYTSDRKISSKDSSTHTTTVLQHEDCTSDRKILRENSSTHTQQFFRMKTVPVIERY